ncbi:MAG: hypothetical protein HY914_05195 [Desulfomonile tiedjei]|nr:hypothetical protein [Desulfomonile tiedjei]
MSLEDLLQGNHPFTGRGDLSDPDPLDQTEAQSADATNPDEADEGLNQPDGSHDDLEENMSPEELFAAYQMTQQLLQQKELETRDLQEALQSLGHRAGRVLRGAEEHSFVSGIRSDFAQDPVAATAMMIKKFQEDALNEFDTRIEQRLQDERNFGRFIRDFLRTPDNAGLGAYEHELEFLIRDAGMPPDDAAALIRSIQKKQETTADRRSAAAKAVRNRSMVESTGEVGEPVDKDKEFDRVLDRAKTLEDMFAGLRKFKF